MGIPPAAGRVATLLGIGLLLVDARPVVAAGQKGTPESYEHPFQDPDRPEEERVSDLIGRMTLEEKVDALAWRAAVPRLGVEGSPHIEGYHGVAQGGPSNWGRRNPTATTQFPQAYGLGATWDPELVRRVAAQEALEARFLYQSERYDRAGLVVRAPNADLARFHDGYDEPLAHRLLTGRKQLVFRWVQMASENNQSRIE